MYCFDCEVLTRVYFQKWKMQTKKKGCGRAAAREQTGSRVSRAQKKLSTKVQELEKKVTDLITSSTRKPGLGMLAV